VPRRVMVFRLLPGLSLWLATGIAANDGDVPTWAKAALSLVADLRRASPTDQHGRPTRSYELADLDADGIMEVLEAVPHDETSGAFMNTELGPAFDWINVYEYRDGSYREATERHKQFLRKRRAHYEFWLRLLQKEAALGSDSQALVQANRVVFVAIVRGYIERIDRLMGP